MVSLDINKFSTKFHQIQKGEFETRFHQTQLTATGQGCKLYLEENILNCLEGNISSCLKGNISSCLGGNISSCLEGNISSCLGGNISSCLGGYISSCLGRIKKNYTQVSWEECTETCEDECSMMHFKE